jgi:hypothetical protein
MNFKPYVDLRRGADREENLTAMPVSTACQRDRRIA